MTYSHHGNQAFNNFNFWYTGDHTPQQDWDDDSMDVSNDNDDMEIPSHLPPKQREMFLRIKQHTMKMKREKSQQQSDQQQNNDNSMKSKFYAEFFLYRQ